MANYADRLFSPQQMPNKDTQDEDNYADKLFSPPELRQGKPGPEVKYRFGKDEPAASTMAHVKAGMVDDVQTKINIYAKARGIDTSRYGVDDQGEIYFVGEDGLAHHEAPDTWAGKDIPVLGRIQPERLKRDVIQGVSDPRTILGGVGATVGPAGAAMGAGAGALVREGAGYLLGDPTTIPGVIGDVALESAVGLVGEKVGGAAIRGLDLAKSREASRIVRAAGRDRTSMSIPEVSRLEMLGQQHGVNLIPPQTTGSPRLIKKWQLLRDLSQTADAAGDIESRQLREVSDAIGKWVDDFMGKATPESAGTRAVEASKKAIEKATKARRFKATPYYNRAFKSGAEVDPAGPLEVIDTLMSKKVPGDPRYAVLKRVRKMIEQAEGDIETLDGVKRYGIDSVLSKSRGDKSVMREMKLVKNSLKEAMGNADPNYLKALKIFEDESSVVTEMTGKKRIIGEIAKTEGDAVEEVHRKVFGGKLTSRNIERVRKVVEKNGGKDAWNELLGIHLQDMFDQASKAGNLPYRMWRETWKNPKHNRMIKAAMTKQQYQNTEDLMEVLNRAGLLGGGQSRTVPAGAMLEEMQSEAMGLGSGLLGYAQQFDLTRPGTWFNLPAVAKWYRETARANYYANLMRALESPKAAKDLKRLLQLKPGSQRLMRQTSTFLTLAAVGDYGHIQERSKREPFQPPILGKPESIQGVTLLPY